MPAEAEPEADSTAYISMEEHQRVMRDLKQQHEDAKYAKHVQQVAYEHELVESQQTTAERCTVALARLLECLSHKELGGPTVDNPKRRGSWKCTLRAASGKFFFILRDLLNENVEQIRDPKPATVEPEQGPSTTKIGNEMHRMLKGQKSKDKWTDEHTQLLDRRITNRLSFGGVPYGQTASSDERRIDSEEAFYGTTSSVDKLLQRRLNPLVVDVPPPVRPADSKLTLPSFWSDDTRRLGAAHNLVECSADELSGLKAIVEQTFIPRVTVDRTELDPMPSKLEVLNAHRSENPALWDAYERKRRSVTTKVGTNDMGMCVVPATAGISSFLERRLCSQTNVANTQLLLHGTNSVSGRSILNSGLRIDMVGANRPGNADPMFGPGIYLAERSSKADEYAHDGPNLDGIYYLIVCRAILGRVLSSSEPGDFSAEIREGPYDSVMGDRERAVGTYREFIFYDEASVYPEFLVQYRRVCDEDRQARNLECEAADEAGGHREVFVSSASGGRSSQRLRGDSERRGGIPPRNLDSAKRAGRSLVSKKNFEFEATIEKPDGAKYGVSVDPQTLRINDIQPYGLIAEWNARQRGTKIQLGDIIVSINGVADPKGMLQELREAEISQLKLQRMRL